MDPLKNFLFVLTDLNLPLPSRSHIGMPTNKCGIIVTNKFE